MEGEYGAVDGVKPKAEAGGEVEEKKKKEQEVGQNDAGKAGAAGGSVEAIDLSGNKLFKNSFRPMEMPTSRVNFRDLAPTQLTIIYGGRVCIFDAIPVDKVREILLIASSAAAATNPIDMKTVGINCPASSPVLMRSPSLQSTASALASPQAKPFPVQSNPLCKLQAELPMARRHSLQNFFEKRRDRLVSKNPYSARSVGAKVSDNSKADLGNQTYADAGCFDKPSMPQEDSLPKAAANVA